MFTKILIANRGAIACRILRTLRTMRITSVAIYSEADADSRHVLDADEAYCIGPAPASESYLSIDSILRVVAESGVQAIHPGYGFLSESLEFARACEDRGIVFIGPAVEHMEAFALKHTAREIAKECGVPLLPGTGILADLQDALTAAETLRYPVMLKSSAGGGGIGMRVCHTPEQLSEAFESVVRLSQSSFGDGSVYLEKFIASAKHIEVQIFGDGKGEIIALGARDCSAQRRHQKVLEETPVPGLGGTRLQSLINSAVLLGKAVNYKSAGTVEFLLDSDTSEFYFLEVNTRLQVEHGVTEQVTGLDLVEMMIQEAARELPPIETLSREPKGSSIEARIYAEDPLKHFAPSPGRLSEAVFPPVELARTETWVEAGAEITPYYDPMIAKIIVTGSDRTDAVARLVSALAATSIHGTETNLRYLRAVVDTETFRDGQVTTSFLPTLKVTRRAFEVIEGGTQTTIQDYPGRLGFWNVGVPPSGPMDGLSFRLANRLVGNPVGAPAIEMTGIGAKLLFNHDALIAVAGADMLAAIDGRAIPMWQALEVKAGERLTFAAASQAGNRTYLSVQGGLDVPEYLASASTFMLGGFGGQTGRALRAGDVVHFLSTSGVATPRSLPLSAIPRITRQWEIAVLYGPHGAPEFFLDSDIEMLFSAQWRVHYQSDRTGVRLLGPKPEWARKDGGEAGLHPSNIHDNAYAIGSIDFTGDMPIILGPDGPSLGGFVCPAVVVAAELWKLGQLKAGDTVQFHRITQQQAEQMEQQLEECINDLSGSLPEIPSQSEDEEAVLRTSTARHPSAMYRADGDKYLLVEYGERELDLGLRLHVHLVEQGFRALKLAGVIDVTPGVRSLQIHYDNRVLPRVELLDALEEVNKSIPENAEITVPSRIVHMPLSWDDPATRLAQAKYMESVRPNAPWCPDNIEFIRRINGLSSVQQVYDTVFAASYLVLGLGDVYLGAPVATPLDPRHRLVTTKYNPARTWTPENAVGIGGAYMCVYGMEGPGGYQLVGRTVQVWNTHRSTRTFPSGSPWSLRFFDQIRFYPVSGDELLQLRGQILHGRYELRTEEQSFIIRQYRQFLESIAPSATAFKATQQAAFQEERERWRLNGLLDALSVAEEMEPETQSVDVREGCEIISSPMTASVFQIALELGQSVKVGERLVVLDAMKTEIVISSSISGTVEEIRCQKGQLVHAGQPLCVLRKS